VVPATTRVLCPSLSPAFSRSNLFLPVPTYRYVSPDFLLSLKHTDLVEYRQANLTVSSTVTSVFEPPAGKEPFNIVYDLTGERDSSRPEIMHMTQTAQLAGGLGAEAQRRKVDAYVRVSYPYVSRSIFCLREN